MTELSPITPPPELVASLRNSAPHGIRDAGVTREIWLVNHAYQSGADQELEACCEWFVRDWTDIETADRLRAARRPKPPSEAEQALELVNRIEGAESTWAMSELGKIRRALERLQQLEEKSYE